jgi:hypothetical protein
MSEPGSGKRGRPTRAEQLEYQKILRPHFHTGITVQAVSGLTHIDQKTISKYFGKWADEIEKQDSRDFQKRQLEARARALRCYGYLMSEEYEMLREINEEIESFKEEEQPVPPYLLSKHSEIIKTISVLNEKIAIIEMSAKADESLNAIIEETIKKYEEPRENTKR